ncbi:response regulator [Actinoplanes sp. DH11]|uniref:response regulator n=1 Tax=Actinoplanes sp. DH11 TaxID=2857011 RepID=UPI001E2FBA72|nr:response regulator [Actinoplanes sp. DH11]
MWQPTERQGPVVLLVEDDEDLREVTTRMLELRGFSVLAAEDPVNAMMKCRVHDGPIDILLTDLGLPGVSGGELSRSAAAVRPSMKVVYVSGLPEATAVKKGLIEAGSPFVTKPYTADVLAGMLRTVLAQGSASAGR